MVVWCQGLRSSPNVSRISAAKGDTKYKYDPVGNLTNVDYAVSADVSFAYDALNRVTSMVDAVGTTAYGYAAGGQLWTEDGPWSSDTVTNTYNNRLRTALSLAQPTGTWTNGFGYDAAKRLTNVISQAGSFAYTLGGASYASPLIKKLSLPNTSYITNIYDSSARLFATALKNSGEAVLNLHAYDYNSANQRTQEARTDASTYDFAYDPIGQLKIADGSLNSEDRGYQYDTAWNLNYRTNAGSAQTFTVNGKNELTDSPAGIGAYDANGNLTNSGVADGWSFYFYDDENRMVQWFYMAVGIGYPGLGDLRADFAYDGLGRLRERVEYAYDGAWVETERVRYVYDGWRVIQERDGNNTPLVSYTRGNDLSGSLEGAGGIGGLLARTDGDGSTFYHADGNGNVTYLVDGSQALAASYRYDPFGNLLSYSGSLAAANVYRFSSKEQHDASGMYCYGHRFYAPGLQRWINRDPIHEEGGINLYGFVGNDGLNAIDDFGMGVTTFGYKDKTIIIIDGAKPPQPSTLEKNLNKIHTGLDAIGIVDPTGIADGGNAALYGLQGNWGNAAISGASMIPFGDAAKLGKYGKKACEAVKTLPIPKVSNPKLENIVSDLYKGAKGANPIGTGSTADAVRNELATGLPTHGTFHTQKAQEYINALNNWLKKNPNASQHDHLVAETLKNDLQSALKGN